MRDPPWLLYPEFWGMESPAEDHPLPFGPLWEPISPVGKNYILDSLSISFSPSRGIYFSRGRRFWWFSFLLYPPRGWVGDLPPDWVAFPSPRRKVV